MNNLRNVKRALSGLTAAIAVVLLFANSGMAQDGRSQINVQGTGVIIKDSNSGDRSQEATRSGGFLVGYSYQFHRWAGVEANYGYTRNTQKYAGPAGPIGIRSDIHQFTGAFVLHVPLEASVVKPYALAGTGALLFDPTDDAFIGGASQQTKATFVYGGGLNFDILPNFGIRTEYRGFVYKTPDFKNALLDLNKVTHLAQPSVGVYFRF